MLDLYSNIVDASPDCVALWMRRTNGCKCEAIAIFFLEPSRAISFKGDDKWPPVQNCPQTDLLLPCLHLWAWSDQFDLFVGLIGSVGLSSRNQIRLEWSPSILDALGFIVLCRCVLETKEEHTATQIVSYLRLQLGLNQIHNQQESIITMSQKTSPATWYFAQNSERLTPNMIINMVESKI